MSAGGSRVFTATLIAVVSEEAREGVLEVLSELARAGIRPVMLVLGAGSETPRREEAGAIVIDGLPAKYLDNAVASLRLSSLPTVAWWRAGDAAALDALASLVDRIVLDAAEPLDAWRRVDAMARHASVSDVRWARLSRWRDLLAQCFDIPEVLDGAAGFDRIEVSGADSFALELAAGWLRTRLPAGRQAAVDVQAAGDAPIHTIGVSGGSGRLLVRRIANASCLETVVELAGAPATSRVVSAGDERLPALLAEELRVRVRERAFEDAVKEAVR